MVLFSVELRHSAPHVNPLFFAADDLRFSYPYLDDSDDDFPSDIIPDYDSDSQELILGEEPPVTNPFRNTPVTRYESWSCDEAEYYCDILVTINGPGMQRHDVVLGTLYWFVWRSSLGRGRFHTRFAVRNLL